MDLRYPWFCRFVLLLLAIPGPAAAQPVLGSRQEVAGVGVYRDLRRADMFYYAPGALTLAAGADGRPRFQLLALRYTGAACRADEGERRFTNIVELTLRLEPVAPATLAAVRRELPAVGRAAPVLRPLPVRYLESLLVASTLAAGESNRLEKIGSGGAFEEERAGAAPAGAYWTERTLTLGLDAHGAQLLWDQVVSGRLAFSLSYAFYGEAVQRSGSGADWRGTLPPGIEPAPADAADTTLATRLLHGGALALTIDVARWPDLLRKVDINEEVPPAYAALQVRCYDFADGLRPDLAVKLVEVEATAVGGRTVGISTRFQSGQPDLHTRRLFFPYAVRMDEPMRYRVTEYTVDGKKTLLDWQPIPACAAFLDVTTPEARNRLTRYAVEVELDREMPAADSLTRVVFTVNYLVGGRPARQEVEIAPQGELPLKQLSFTADKDQRPVYSLRWEWHSGGVEEVAGQPLTSEYYLLRWERE